MANELQITPEIEELGLEEYARELDRDGLTIVPPEVNAFGLDRIDRIVERILERAHEMTGVRFSLDEGPLEELEFPQREITARDSGDASGAGPGGSRAQPNAVPDPEADAAGSNFS